MSEDSRFSVAKLPTYSLAEIARHHVENMDRARKLYQLGASYNDRAGESLNKDRLGEAQRWSELRDIANEMGNDAKKRGMHAKLSTA